MTHRHIYSEYVGFNEERETITARCTCGDKVEFSRQANKRVVHSAHGAGAVVIDFNDSRVDAWDETV